MLLRTDEIWIAELELLDRGDCHTAKQKTDHLINAHKLITGKSGILKS